MRLDPRLTWEDIDMRMEYVGARASYDNAIDMASPGHPMEDAEFSTGIEESSGEEMDMHNMVSFTHMDHSSLSPEEAGA